MNQDEAMALAAELASAYPGRSIGELSLAKYAEAFVPCERGAAVIAVGHLVQTFATHPPSLGQLQEQLRLDAAYPQPALPLTAREEIGYRSKQILSDEIQSHGWFHLRRFMRGEDGHREGMYEPWNCECGFVAEVADPPWERMLKRQRKHLGLVWS